MGRYDDLTRTGTLSNLAKLQALSREKTEGTPAHLRPGKAALPTLPSARVARTAPPATLGQEDARVSRATQEDRDTRARWGIRLKSPYLSITRIPEAVGPGDYPTARAIMFRIDRALEIRGRWTPAERNRLRAQYTAWERRASGRDVVFNLEGWKKKPAQDAAAQAARSKNREFAGLLHDIRTTVLAATGTRTPGNTCSTSQPPGPTALPAPRPRSNQRIIGD